MAKFRYVNTAIWDDEWFTGLDALEQHLFLYFLTNAYTNIAGIYQVPLRKVAFETGMDQEKVKKILLRFESDGRVFYETGWVVMKNWHKHQSLNPNQTVAVVNFFNALPEWLRTRLLDPVDKLFIQWEPLLKGYVSLDKPSLSLRYNPNSNPNLNPNPNPNTKTRGGRIAGQMDIGVEDVPA